MIDLPPPHRHAVVDDAAALAELVNVAGEGLPLHVWSQMAGGQRSAWDVGRDRARRESGGFSYRNAVVREERGRIVACLIGYPLEDDPEPGDYTDMPPMFVPLQQLEDQAPGSWYVNVLATYPDQRGKGCGSALLAVAEELARGAGKASLSVIVSDANSGARRLYERHGFIARGTRPMVKSGWENPGQNWLLLAKTLAAGASG